MWEKYKNILPLIVVSAFSLEVLYDTIDIGQFYYPIGNYLGILSIIGAFICFFKFRIYFNYYILFMLILGIFNIIIFKNGSTTIKFSIGILPVFFFQSFSVFISFLYILLNFKYIKKGIKEEKEFEKKETKKFSNEEYLKLKEYYSGKSITELEKIVNNDNFSIEAQKAVADILDDRAINKF